MIDFAVFSMGKSGINGFGYKSPLKDVVDLCAYTGKRLARDKRTLEHIRPHSQGGASSLANYLMTEGPLNHERGNMPFDKWLKSKPGIAGHIQNYLNKLRGIKIDGQDYVEAVKRSLNEEARGVVAFAGRSTKSLDVKL